MSRILTVPKTATRTLGSEARAFELVNIWELHTLGPDGTNCAMAAREWFLRLDRAGRVQLHATLELAAGAMPMDGSAALMACIAYPDLHTLMFSNHGRLALADCLVLPTFDMVLASRTGMPPRTVSSHPANPADPRRGQVGPPHDQQSAGGHRLPRQASPRAASPRARPQRATGS